MCYDRQKEDMMDLSDSITPIEQVLMKLTVGPQPQDLPMFMQDKHGHEVRKHLVTLKMHRVVPIYMCEECQVGYRFQECALIPGDEGKSE